MNANLPTITSQPNSGYAAVNSAYTLSCKSANSGETTWYKDGQKILDQTSDPASLITKTEQGDLFILKFLPQFVGVYYCNVSNSFGFVLSQNASVNIPGRLHIRFPVNKDYMMCMIGLTENC